MTIDEARELVAYDRWANGLVFAAAAGLSGEVWLRRWLGESPTSVPGWVATADLSELRSKLSEVETERGVVLAGLAEGDLERVVSYRTLSGQAHADPLCHVVRHMVNHSTYHRGQIATQLRQLGTTPPGTDLIAYLWQAK